MPKLGLAFHKSFLLHDAGPGHPDRAERIEVIMDVLQNASWWNSVEVIEPRKATSDEISLVHSPEYIESMRELCFSGGEFLPAMEAAVGHETYPAAIHAVGAGLTLADGVAQGKWDIGFAPVRPPGHHSLRDRPWGFCIFNNIAILAKYLIKKHRIERIGIVDFDVHHGNGTQQAFWSDSKVLFCSIHQEDIFPSNSGNWHDKGEGAGENLTINIPMPGNNGDEDFIKALDRYATPAFKDFKPEILLVSAGFDGHYLDILSSVKLTKTAYQGFARLIKKYAEGCDGKVITILEGGYDVQGLTDGVSGYFDILMRDE